MLLSASSSSSSFYTHTVILFDLFSLRLCTLFVLCFFLCFFFFYTTLRCVRLVLLALLFSFWPIPLRPVFACSVSVDVFVVVSFFTHHKNVKLENFWLFLGMEIFFCFFLVYFSFASVFLFLFVHYYLLYLFLYSFVTIVYFIFFLLLLRRDRQTDGED